MRSTLHGTLAPPSPLPSATAAPPTSGDAAPAGHSAGFTHGAASAAASPVVADHPVPPDTAASAHLFGATGTALLSPRSHRNPRRGDLLQYLPGRPVVVDMCETHLIAFSAVVAAAWGTGVSAKAKDVLKRDGLTGTGACRFVPLYMSHETYGRASSPAFGVI